MALESGARLGPYEIAALIGVGGMGEVYRARDTTRGRDVAIKILPASFSTDAMRVTRFQQEARTLAWLNHSNIAHIYGLERSAGDTAIVMELVDGTTLMERIAQGPMPVAERTNYAHPKLESGCKALMHGSGVCGAGLITRGTGLAVQQVFLEHRL